MIPEAPSDPPLRTAWTAEGPFAFTDEGRGVPLVMLHGLPGSARDFRWLASAIGGRVRCVRVEQPGFGQTPAGTETGTELRHRAHFALEAIDALGLDRFAVLGHSIGGPVAIAVAAATPARCLGLALLASVGLHPHRLARRMKRRPELARLLHLGPVQRALLPSIRAGFRRSGFPSSTPDGEMIQTMRVFSRLDFEANRRAARAVAAPSFVAWAEDDRLVEPTIGMALSAELPPGPRLAFADGGHNLQKTRAVELADALASWLSIVDA